MISLSMDILVICDLDRSSTVNIFDPSCVGNHKNGALCIENGTPSLVFHPSNWLDAAEQNNLLALFCKTSIRHLNLLNIINNGFVYI